MGGSVKSLAINLKKNIKQEQNGQAMVEFLVAAMFFLVPLFLAISALGKFIDVQHTTDMAARYAAWERTVWYENGASNFYSINQPNQKSAAGINNEIALRILNDRSNIATVIKDSDKSASNFVNGVDPMWHDTSGTAYLNDYSQLATLVSYEEPKKDVAGAVLTALASVNVKGLFNFVPPLPTDTLAVAKVSLNNVAKDSGVYQHLWSEAPAWAGLDFEATGAILSNTWSSNSKVGTRAMVAEAVPTAQGLGAIVTAAKVGIAPWDWAIPSKIEVGKIEVDEVPADRLK
ncbi:Flp pilus assembly protein TadG [Undibacterium sp. GrIS 1.8]|uniref:TadE/TadG family type IV pilus assembly protein n=1 Tax=unclassified Undibacterium TaxID=2630295 RepID=UPI0033987F00